MEDLKFLKSGLEEVSAGRSACSGEKAGCIDCRNKVAGEGVGVDGCVPFLALCWLFLPSWWSMTSNVASSLKG